MGIGIKAAGRQNGVAREACEMRKSRLKLSGYQFTSIKNPINIKADFMLTTTY